MSNPATTSRDPCGASVNVVVASALFMTALAACKPDLKQGHFACNTDSDCPTRWACWSDGRCYEDPEPVRSSDVGVSESADGSPSDAGRDEDASMLQIDARGEGPDLPSLDLGPVDDGGPLGAEARLAHLGLTPGWLVPRFDPERSDYYAILPAGIDAVRFVAELMDLDGSLEIGGYPALSGVPTQVFDVVPGSTTWSILVTNGQARHTYVVRFLERALIETELTAPDQSSSGSFGRQVAMSGDTVVVGAPNENGSLVIDDQVVELMGSGAVRVFRSGLSGWVLEATLHAPNASDYDGFGTALAIDGDTIVVGTPAESSSARGIGQPALDDAAPASGAAYVYRRTDDVWTLEAYLKASNAEAGGLFGWSVAIHQDTIAVGSPGDQHLGEGPFANDSNAPNSGAVFVFARAQDRWTQEARLKASWVEAEDKFGSAVAVHGNRLVSGTMWEAGSGAGINSDASQRASPESGAVYAFERDAAGTWSLDAYLKAAHPDAGDHFGRSVSLLGDTLAVGAPQDAGGGWGLEVEPLLNSQPFSGAVYIFVRGPSGWVQEAHIKALLPWDVQFFGASLELEQDRVFVGAQSVSDFPGAVDVYRRRSGTWEPVGSIVPPLYTEGFGSSIAATHARAAVGAPSPINGTTLICELP